MIQQPVVLTWLPNEVQLDPDHYRTAPIPVSYRRHMLCKDDYVASNLTPDWTQPLPGQFMPIGMNVQATRNLPLQSTEQNGGLVDSWTSGVFNRIFGLTSGS